MPTESSHISSSPLVVLGINFSGADPNAALVIDGVVVAAVEEERFLREKHAVNRVPEKAIAYCVKEAARHGRSIDLVAFGWDCDRYSDGGMRTFFDREVNARYPVDPATRAWQERMIQSFHRDVVGKQIRDALKRGGIDRDRLPDLRCFPHHRTHASGAFLLSRFESAFVITLDGSGEDLCTAIWSAEGREMSLLKSFQIPHSLGWFYAAVTEYLGFEAYDGEYKVMGLAPYGSRDPEIGAQLRQVLTLDGEGYRVNPSYIHYGGHTYSDRFTDMLADLLGGPPRARDGEVTARDQSIAAEAQSLFEEAVLGLVRWTRQTGGSRPLCLAGGAALNCKMSQRILECGLVDDVFVLPNAGDGGQALSASVLLSAEMLHTRPQPLESLALGPEYSDLEIKAFLDECSLEAEPVRNLPDRAARDIAEGRVVGWFQGRMEFGPRALGQRSILADPRHVASRDRVNRVVKYREYWRPFCPSVTAEAAPRYFARLTDARFMAITLPVRPERRDEIPAVVHVDGTSRPQFVHADTHPLYHALLEAFAARTGVPVLLNTSFNVKGEPIVCTPRDAVRHFYSSGMDVLYLGGFRLAKHPS